MKSIQSIRLFKYIVAVEKKHTLSNAAVKQPHNMKK